ACAAARHCFEETLSVAILPAWQVSRRFRMKDPAQEQAAINEYVQVETLIVDHLGVGETPFAKQILLEILDGRDFGDQAGLIATSQYPLNALVDRFDDDTITSRLAGMCQIIEIQGDDFR